MPCVYAHQLFFKMFGCKRTSLMFQRVSCQGHRYVARCGLLQLWWRQPIFVSLFKSLYLYPVELNPSVTIDEWHCIVEHQIAMAKESAKELIDALPDFSQGEEMRCLTWRLSFYSPPLKIWSKNLQHMMILFIRYVFHTPYVWAWLGASLGREVSTRIMINASLTICFSLHLSFYAQA